MSIGKAKPASTHLLSEPEIVASIGQRLQENLANSRIRWLDWIEDYDNIRGEIESVIPGFESYNRKSRQNGGFYLPNSPRDFRKFDTDSGKANFISNQLSSFRTEDGKFVMMTIRAHDQYNTTIYGLDDRYRGVKGGRRIVLVNKNDMANNNWTELQEVNISSHFEGNVITSERWYVVPYEIPPGNVATYFPESNELIPLDSVADWSNTPTSKSVLVSIDSVNQ